MIKVLFAGTSKIGVPTLEALSKSDKFSVSCVLTAPDSMQGRSKELKPSPVKVKATELCIPVLQFDKLRTLAREEIKKYDPDCMVCFSYGKIFGPMFLSLFKQGSFNIHPSNLPLLRGPAPLQYTILNLLRSSAISVQSIGLEMDAGDIWYKKHFKLDGTETNEKLETFVANEVGSFITDVIYNAVSGKIKAEKQVGDISYTSMISKEDAVIDFNSSLSLIHAKIRAFYPHVKAETVVMGKKVFLCGVYGGFQYLDNPIKIHEGEVGSPVILNREKGIGFLCGDNNVLFVNSLQIPGKKELYFKDFLNGNRWLSSIIHTQTT